MEHRFKSGPHPVSKVEASFPDKFLSSPLRFHEAYVPGEQPASFTKAIKLNTNENPYPPSPLVQKKIAAEIHGLNLYPNAKSNDLRKRIAEMHDLEFEQVIVGNGSDDLLNLCVRSFADPEKSIGMLEPSYSLYKVLASIQGAPLKEVRFHSQRFELPVDDIVSSGTNLFFLTCPHAPSGRTYATSLIEEICSDFKGILVVDEAYADFARENAISLLSKHRNLVITRTFSKSYSLAGLRVGYAMGDPAVIRILDKAREAYNLDRLAQVGALAALQDQKYFNDKRTEIIRSRDSFGRVLENWGWTTVPSSANFIFTEPVDAKGRSGQKTARDLFDYLSARQVLVRYFPQSPLTSSYLRISIGKPEQMTMLIDHIEEWKKQEHPK